VEVRRDPFMKKQIMETIGITSVGMFGDIGGWPINIGFHSSRFAVGAYQSARAKLLGQLSLSNIIAPDFP
jgi:hypothetical protein